MADVRQRVAAGREFLQRLAGAMGQQETPYAKALKQYAAASSRMSDAYTASEYLAPINDPVYFTELFEQVSSHGLQYLGEAEAHLMGPTGCSPAAIQALGGLPAGLVEQQQCLDFLRNTQFRQSLVCQQEVRLERTPRLKPIETLFIAARTHPRSTSPDLSSNAIEQFGNPQAYISTGEPALKCALAYLATRWPEAVFLDELAGEAWARSKCSASEAEVRERLAKDVLHGYFSMPLFELYVDPPKLTIDIAEFPVVSPLARKQAERGPQVTNLCHRTIEVPPEVRQLLPHMDGSRSREELQRMFPATHPETMGATQTTTLEYAARLGLLLKTGAVT